MLIWGWRETDAEEVYEEKKKDARGYYIQEGEYQKEDVIGKGMMKNIKMKRKLSKWS